VILDTTQLEAQQDLLIQRFGENKELLQDVQDGMKDNLRLAKQNIEYLKRTNPASSLQGESAGSETPAKMAPPKTPPPTGPR